MYLNSFDSKLCQTIKNNINIKYKVLNLFY